MPAEVLNHATCCLRTYLDGVGQGDCDGQGQALRNSHHQHCHPDDKELDEILNIHRGALGLPLPALDHKRLDHKVQHQDDDRDG